MGSKIGYIGIEDTARSGCPLRCYVIQQHPRKELLKQLGYKHAEKMYVEQKLKAIHVGYIIAGHWIHIYEVHTWIGGQR